MSALKKTRLAVFVDHIGIGLLTPLTFVYFSIATPISIEEVSVAATIAGLFAIPFGLLSGVVVDRIGVRSSLILNIILAALASGIFLVVQNFAFLVIGQLIATLSSRINWSSWAPYVHSLVNETEF